MRRIILILCALLSLTGNVRAFSLLGPHEDWMQETNGYKWYGHFFEIGGPKDLGQEYRWNVPTLTYAFDASFLEFFGSNGVAEVEKAIQILNALPPASDIALTNFPFHSKLFNPIAGELLAYDLKSYTLCLLVEHLGLAQPSQNIFALRYYDRNLFYPFCLDEYCWGNWAIPDFILERNFDPTSLFPSHGVNETLYTGTIIDIGFLAKMVTGNVDPGAEYAGTVADFQPQFGEYFSGLTRDDVGGLAYLLSKTNVNFETLLPSVHGIGSNTNSYVNGALRPGIEKLTFIRQEYDPLSNQPIPITN